MNNGGTFNSGMFKNASELANSLKIWIYSINWKI